MTKEDKAEKYASETWSDTPMSGKPRNEYLYRLSSKELAKSAYLAGYDEAQARAHEEILDLKSSRDAWKHLHEQALSVATEISGRLGDAEAEARDERDAMLSELRADVEVLQDIARQRSDKLARAVSVIKKIEEIDATAITKGDFIDRVTNAIKIYREMK